MSDKIEEKKKEEAPKMRQIIIETDGNRAVLVKNEASGGLELMAILQMLIQTLTQPPRA